MSTELQVQGDTPGVLQVCSPVVVHSGVRRGRHGVVVSAMEGTGAWFVCLLGYPRYLTAIPAKDLALDLTNPTGAFHAEEWLRGARQDPRYLAYLLSMDPESRYDMWHALLQGLGAGDELLALARTCRQTADILAGRDGGAP